jgi:iron(III) transport system ATP-binding protein
MSFLILEGIEKSFGDLRVLDGISLGVEEGETLALLGPSGSGKTTLLRLLAGFEALDGRRNLVEGRDVAPLPAARRRFGMVFQHFALFPHLTVGENVAFGLAGGRRARRRGREAIGRRVAEVLALTDLAGFEPRRIGELSGGQQQRVALARALAPEPRLLLLDEPLSNLDPALRERTRRELKAAIRRVGITTILVTHEQEEAFDFGERVAVLHGGRLEQVGPPAELYREPATRFVATFVGRASVLAGRFVPPDAVALPGGVAWRGVAAEEIPAGAEAEIVVRPESLALVAPASLTPPSAAGAPAVTGAMTAIAGLPGRVVERRYAGSHTYLTVALEPPEDAPAAAREVEVLAPGEAPAEGRVAVVLRAGAPPARIFRRLPRPSASGQAASGRAAAGERGAEG